ncbi:uncharacterized aarF domain-containing protein kinase 1 isoform X3 [Sesamum indicum]|uniref:Uncharacterized aarF domain-containing protein kinase 1 isoform X3 n=1 Tax=Sesamum indicum TaxID=4182 RepID=A0A8M8UYX6_SESIN|nr:uncharacterized aarF domain-containing protein kinase 1 isoform X3 [Sesamum indicum]
MRRYGGVLKFGAKTSVYLLTAAGCAALAHDSFNSSDTLDFPSGFLNGVVRSSRAVFAISSCVIDYKYSLRGLPAGSDEYGRVLSEPCAKSQENTHQLFHLYRIRFLSFDEKPVAAASIAQVHHAVLKDHQEVAVKVQYPGLEYQMKFDVTTMAFLSRSVAWLFPEYRFEWMVSEFTKSIASELDFIQEAKNSERAANNFKKNRTVRIPRVYWDFTSRQVLTMQFCEGHKVNDLEFLHRMGISPLEVAKALVDVFAEMIFVHGFLHGDPHPGNILVSPQGRNGFSLVILDHGVYKQLSEDFRKKYCRLWEALIILDSPKIQQLGESFGVGKYARYFPVIFTGRTINSKSVLGRGMSPEEKKYLKDELKSLKMEDISSFMESLPPDFLTILRTDGLLRSLISKLGAPQRIRLLSYAKCALHGLSAEGSSESDSAVLLKARFKTSIKYIRLWILLEIMEFVAYMNDIRHSMTARLRQFILSAGDHIWSLGPLLISSR